MSRRLDGLTGGDSGFDRTLGRPLAMALGVLLAARVAGWVPEYLTWPWWPDHDVFGTMARGWDAGLLPYRDLLGNNFPGTIYLFWGLGRVFGWGTIAPFYALDAAMVVGLAGLLVAWSARRFGRALPGLLGAVAMVTYFTGLDFSQAAQRDGQGPILAIAGLLVAEAWPGRGGRLVSVILFAAGASIRPQVVLFVPAFWLAIEPQARPAGTASARSPRPLLEWHLAAGAMLALCFLPLALAGVVGDMIGGLRLVAYGGSYNKVGPLEVGDRLASQFQELRLLMIPLAALAARFLFVEKDRGPTSAWVAALLGVALYGPLSPVMRPYTLHPLWLVWSVYFAILAREILAARGMASTLRFLALGTLVYLAIAPSATTLPQAPDGRAGSAGAPRGYAHPYPFVPRYPWADYRALLDHLKASTGPRTRVANILLGVAVTAPVDRLPALPAESATWLYVVRPDDVSRFVETLERTPDSVVVWDRVPRSVHGVPASLEAAILRLYEPRAKFGDIEVWSRKPGT